jgi:hypothetical protein
VANLIPTAAKLIVNTVARASNTATNLRQKRSAFPGFSFRGGADAVEDGVRVSIELTSFHEENALPGME